MHTCKLTIDFTSSGNSRGFVADGWSLPEPWGTWSTGDRSSLKLRASSAISLLRLKAHFQVYSGGGTLAGQACEVVINGTTVFSGKVSGETVLESDVWQAPDAPVGEIHIAIFHPDSISPASLGLSTDERRLAFLLTWIEICFDSEPGHAAILPVQSGLAAQPPSVPLIRLIPQGNMANRMIQCMVALKIAGLVPGCEICNVSLPEWGIVIPDRPCGGRTVFESQEQHIDVMAVAESLRNGSANVLEYSGFGQRMENFDSKALYSELFRPRVDDFRRFGKGDLVINVRSGDIVSAIHEHYTLIPPKFYIDIIKLTGLRPVFMGQVSGNSYTDMLRHIFQDAEFIESQGPQRDFESIRTASHIVVSVSTFSWLAAWLSSAETIVMPVNGLFNPMQESRVDLLPVDESRYRFYLFPYNIAVKEDQIVATHDALSGLWRMVSPEMLESMRSNRPRYKPEFSDFERTFDACYYLARWPEYAKAIEVGNFRDPLDHYKRVGFNARRIPFQLDRAWYARSYPIAAFEVGSGDFLDLEHHYAAIGKARGYHPVPAAAQ